MLDFFFNLFKKKDKEYIKISVNGFDFEVKKLSPSDFLDGYFPFSFFELEKSKKTIYDNVKNQEEEFKKMTESEIDTMIQRIMMILNKCVKTINGELFDAQKYLPIANIETYFQLLFEVQKMSFIKFNEVQKIDKDRALTIAQMAEDLGKTPIEIIAEGEAYTPMDAHVFNLFIWATKKQRDYEEMKKQVAEMKKR